MRFSLMLFIDKQTNKPIEIKHYIVINILCVDVIPTWFVAPTDLTTLGL